MSTTTNHPGVTLRSKIAGGTLYLTFRNPFDGDGQKTKSSQTASLKDATAIAEKVSEAIHSTLENLRDDYPQIIYDLLEVKPLTKKIEQAKKALKVPSTVWQSHDMRASRAAANEALSEMESMRQQREYWRSKAITAQAALGRNVLPA